MSYRHTKGLLKRKLPGWTGKEWYHQRFDGTPYFINFIAEAEINIHEKRKRGGDFTVHYCFFAEDKGDWYIEMEDMQKVVDSIIGRGEENPDIGKELVGMWQKEKEAFYAMCFEIADTDLGKIHDEELMGLHDRFARAILENNSSSSLIDGFALGTDEMLAERIREIFERENPDMRFTELFSTLTAPVHLSFANEAEASLFSVAETAEHEGLSFSGTIEEIKSSLEGTQTQKALKEHQENYFWVHNNYADAYVLDIDYFIGEVKHLFEQNIDFRKHVMDIRSFAKRSAKRKEELMNLLDMDEKTALLIRISEEFTHWQDERKKATMWTIHYMGLILDEISRRIKISKTLLKYVTWSEMSDVMNGSIERDELAARHSNCVYYWDKEGFECLTGEEADNVKEVLLGSKDLSDIDDFRGLAAMTGKARGTVRIVKSAKEIGKVEDGDILVAVMTRPDYIPAMKRAAAIVTDEGGVTCHAAIVSRELGKPCIIGTKIATKALRDGQVVTVNANHGWVKVEK